MSSGHKFLCTDNKWAQKCCFHSFSAGPTLRCRGRMRQRDGGMMKLWAASGRCFIRLLGGGGGGGLWEYTCPLQSQRDGSKKALTDSALKRALAGVGAKRTWLKHTVNPQTITRIRLFLIGHNDHVAESRGTTAQILADILLPDASSVR